jgi:hypothetical protein
MLEPTSAPLSTMTNVVPEPTGILPMVLAGMGLLMRRVSWNSQWV